MFSNLDKKILIRLILVTTIILLIGLAVYKYGLSLEPRVKNYSGGAQTEIK